VPVSRQRKVNKAKKRPRSFASSAAPGESRASGQARGRKGFKVVVIALIVAVAASAIAYVVANRRGQAGTEVTSASGLKYTDLKVGDGASPRMGQSVKVHYIGWLENGKEFNNSYKSGAPIDFALGPGLIPGWNEALQTMKVGGKRRLVIPPNLAYGVSGRPPSIPPNATLTFEIELLGVK
jgi:FKBP-type peptidyl-prolyl cis-trans isomerase